MSSAQTPIVQVDAEDIKLRRLGYAPQFHRVLGLFSDFSLGYSYMCPMAGVFALFGLAVSTAGPAFIWTLPIVLLGQFLVCLVFAEAASAYPIAGGIYQWARRVGGARWGFLTAWVYLLALVATIAGVAAGNAPFLASLIGMTATSHFTAAATIGLTLVALAANLAGTKFLGTAARIGLWCGLAGLAFCGLYLLLFARVQPFSVVFSTFGHGAHGLVSPMLAAGLMGVWIFFGFEACGDLAEEVEGASRVVPRAMLLTIVCGGVTAILMALGILLAVPDLVGASNGSVDDPITAALVAGSGVFGSKMALLCLNIVNISSAASIMASTSRLLFSLGRDGSVIGHRVLARLDTKRGTPVAAINITAGFVVLVLCIGLFSSDALTQIISFATTGIYTAFAMVVVVCLIAGVQGWRPDGAFRLGGAGLIVRAVALAFGVGAILNLAWPRTPETGWFANWFVVIAMGIIVLLGLVQMMAFIPRDAAEERIAAE